MTEIRDPIHGYIMLNRLALDLIASPEMQRLRWIRQLGLASLVYPGANHTRFEHSLGVYHLAGVLADHLQIDEEDKLKVQAAGLLHDIGHGPLSHATEAALAPYIRQEHESIIDLLKRGRLREVLDWHGINPAEIQSLISGEKLGQLISGEIDADRMDYLIRDAHYTGVAYGVIDQPRLIEKMRLHNGELVVESGGVQAATSLLISRLLMQPAVYYHHVCRISECMIASGIRHMVDEGRKAEEIKALDDMELFTAMSGAGGFAAEMAFRIKTRRLFKRAVYVGLESLEPAPRTKISELRLAQEIAEEAGVDPEHVLIDNPALPDTAEGSFPALIDGDVRPLRDVSPLVAILERAQRATWRFGIYTRKEDREQVSRGAGKILNLKKIAVQHTFSDID